MKSEKLELPRSSGNVSGVGYENADAEQNKTVPAAEIIKAADWDGDTSPVRATHGTGIATADFLRIGNADIGRFTIDRLMSILNHPA